MNTEIAQVVDDLVGGLARELCGEQVTWGLQCGAGYDGERGDGGIAREVLDDDIGQGAGRGEAQLQHRSPVVRA